MGEITLVRHGQANSEARDEAEYDRLSELGQRQAAWLGEHLRAHEPPFDAVLCGSLKRHISTAAEMGELGPAPVIDDRLNEMDYFNLGQAMQDRHGTPPPGPDDHAAHLTEVVEAWHRAEIMGNESFAAFETRVTSVLAEAAQPGRRILCVTSGGVIGMMVRSLLGLDPRRMAQILLPIYNSSIHRVAVTPHGTLLAGYNAVPHLAVPDRAHALTHF